MRFEVCRTLAFICVFVYFLYSHFCNNVHISVVLQSEIGFGKLETYVKLDKLGEVRRSITVGLWLPFIPYAVEPRLKVCV